MVFGRDATNLIKGKKKSNGINCYNHSNKYAQCGHS